MKLFLHWLRWDLRRFRWLLLAWTALLAGFSAMLWYQNANIRTIELKALSYNMGLSSLVFVLWIFLLIPILSSDPAAGVEPFWKTRPPAGYAVAGAKLFLAAVFFLFLPMLCWWLVLKTSSAPEDINIYGPGQTWMGFLWWIGCITVSCISFAAAAAGSAYRLAGRLLAGAAATVAVIAAVSAWRVLTGDFPEGLSQYARSTIWFSMLESAFLYTRTPVVGLITAAGLCLLARRRRHPGPAVRLAHLVLPAAAMVLNADQFAGRFPMRQESVAPHVRPEMFKDVAVLPPKVRDPLYLIPRQHSLPGDPGSNLINLPLKLELQGLPDGYTASAAWWSELTLMPDAGSPVRTREPMPTSYPGFSQSGEGTAITCGADFHEDELRPLSMTPCRARGVLRLLMSKRCEVSTPVRAGNHLEVPGGHFIITNAAGRPRQQGVLVHGTFIGNSSWGDRAGHLLRLSRERDGQLLDLRINPYTTYSAYFLYTGRSDWEMMPGYRTPRLPAARYSRDAAAGRAEEWQLTAFTYETEGYIECPVSIDIFVMPRVEGDERQAEDILDQLRVPQDATPDAVERQMTYALGLVDASGQKVGPFDMSDPLLQALSRYLARFSRAHLPALLAVAEQNLPPGNMGVVRPFDTPFCIHVASLLEAADVAALRQTKPQLVRYFRLALAGRNLIPYAEGHGLGWAELSDGELQQQWLASTRTDSLNSTALLHAVRRGLPWVPATLAELADLVPGDVATIDGAIEMSKLSDCPADHAAAIPWLQHNAARLTWDAPAKRWVLPVP